MLEWDQGSISRKALCETDDLPWSNELWTDSESGPTPPLSDCPPPRKGASLNLSLCICRRGCSGELRAAVLGSWKGGVWTSVWSSEYELCPWGPCSEYYYFKRFWTVSEVGVVGESGHRQGRALRIFLHPSSFPSLPSCPWSRPPPPLYCCHYRQNLWTK